MISTNLDSVDIPQQDYETYLQSCASQFKKLHKFKTNSTVEIRVYQGGKGFGNQLLPFRQACEIIYSKSSFRTVFLTCADVNTFKLTELDIINWLLEGDIHFIISTSRSSSSSSDSSSSSCQYEIFTITYVIDKENDYIIP